MRSYSSYFLYAGAWGVFLSSSVCLAESPRPTSQIEASAVPTATKSVPNDFEQLLRDLSRTIASAEKVSDKNAEIDALARRGEVYQQLGLYEAAIRDLKLGLRLAGNGPQVTRLLGSLGYTLFLAGHDDEAKEYLEASIARARSDNDPLIVATGLNNLGNLLSAQDKNTLAIAAYVESAELARKTGNALHVARALTNHARTLAATLDETTRFEPADGKTLKERRSVAVTLLMDAWARLEDVPASHEKAHTLISMGELFGRLDDPTAQKGALRSLSEAARIGESLDEHRTSSYAFGYLGQLYEHQRRYTEALQLTRRAAFLAQHVNAPEILYLWHWQSGRIFRELGDLDAAIASYRQALYNLQSIRHELSGSPRSGRSKFRQQVGPVYFELADLLLRHGASANDSESIQRDLVEARATVELLKAAELRDYFQDDCVTALQSRVAGVDRVAPRTAALYPILLPDRTELLLSLPGEMKRYTVPIGSRALSDEVRAFRMKLEKRTTREYLVHAQKLYDWLLRPMAADLRANSIETLVWVPDGALRTVPLAALHDGERFVIARYAIATTPGLTLTDARPLKRENVQLLLSGLTKPVQGFPSLPNVSAEIDEIHTLYGGRVLLDQDFVVPKLERELSSTSYSVVHIASHGHFDSDPKKSFLLAFDQKLGMDRLEQLMQFGQYRRDPLELLTLSACQTATGDDRAALGLAGVAIKAGARSALATLWFINDEASSDLVANFYQALTTPHTSKAMALQQAQLRMLGDPRWGHPSYWAPFLLIGSWL